MEKLSEEIKQAYAVAIDHDIVPTRNVNGRHLIFGNNHQTVEMTFNHSLIIACCDTSDKHFGVLVAYGPARLITLDTLRSIERITTHLQELGWKQTPHTQTVNYEGHGLPTHVVGPKC